MLKNYFKIALRNFRKNKLHTFILISGLSIGMAACIVLFEYISFELSFDRFHEKSSQIYRVVNDRFKNGERVQKGTITYPTIGPTMHAEYPEVLNYTRMGYGANTILQKDQELLRIENAYYVDENFFQLFDYPLLAGDRKNALKESNQVAISKKTAHHFFDISDDFYAPLIGELLSVDGAEDPYKVVAVFDNFPDNALFQPEFLGSYQSMVRYFGEGADNSWRWSDFYHFVELAPGTDVVALEGKFKDFSDRHFRGEEVSGSEEYFYLQPLTDAHLYSTDLEYEIGNTGNGKAVWSLLIIAFFILTIAWINYLNLSTVRSIERAKEVGIRKVVGAAKQQLARQFITEALILNGISLVFALQLSQFLEPWFSQVLGVELSLHYIFSNHQMQYLLLSFLAVFLIGGVLLSGLYPSWLLSKQQTSQVLKGIFQQSRSSQILRKGLVIFQFTASIALVVSCLLVYQQIRFMNQQELGLNIDQVLRISGPELSNWDSTFIGRIHTFKESLATYPNIKSASITSRIPGQGTGRIFEVVDRGSESNTSYMANFINTDYAYAKTFDLPIIAGRFFQQEDHHFNGDLVDKIVINEAASKMLGYANADEVLGKNLQFWDKDWTVVGISRNHHQQSLRYPIEPLIFIPYLATNHQIAVKIGSGNIDQTLAQIKKEYDQFFPGNAFDYQFLDERFQNLYEADASFGKILLFFTLLTIFIACLGLFGLASYTAFLRNKEIGIRKVLGASIQSIITLLSIDFLKLVVIAAGIATPLAWFIMNRWLMDFHYRIEINWWVFILAGLIAFFLAFITIGFQAFRAAAGNPVEALKND